MSVPKVLIVEGGKASSNLKINLNEFEVKRDFSRLAG
jgi:hypothetical protein